MKPTEPVNVDYVDKDEIGQVLEELNAAAQRGDLATLAVRVYRSDGTYEDIVAGYKTEEERVAMLADLQNRINTKSN